VPNAVPARVLVVDDEPSLRLLLRVNLELEGHEVVEAGLLAEAREAIAEGGVDIVVLDLNLRGERSSDLVAECHALEPPVPVVLVTGSVELTGEHVLDADAVVAKPFEPAHLLETVRRLLETQRV
jgi:DNA-binding NtrC family response regulator